MNRNEFLYRLERALSGNMSSDLVRSHVNYYTNYIDAQVRNGRAEREVLEELGEPRLIAKSIIDANERNGGATYADTQEAEFKERTEFEQPQWVQKLFNIAMKMPPWLWMVIIGTIVLIVLAIAASLLSFLLPILLPALCILLVVQVFRNNVK